MAKQSRGLQLLIKWKQINGNTESNPLNLTPIRVTKVIQMSRKKWN